MSYVPNQSGQAMGTITWSTIATAALFNTSEERYNQFIENGPFFNLLQQKSQVVFDGGEQIKRDVRFGESDNIVPFSKFDQIPLSDFDDTLPTVWQWKNSAYAAKVANEDLIVLEGSDIGAAVNLLTDIVDYGMRGFKKKYDEWLFGDGSAYQYKVPLGLGALVATNPTTGNLAGLDRATYVWWRNSYINANGTWRNVGIAGTNADYPLAMWNDLKVGGEMPEIIISHPDLQEYYERTIPDYFQVTMPAEGNVGFGYSTLTYKQLPWYTDYNCPEGYMYFLRLSDFQFVVSREWNFKSTGFIPLTATGIMGQACFIILRCALLCLKPSNQGVIYGFTGY